ncbi:Sorting nexin-25 [Halotydeus destructor]|nr:Sorting nexin-25 [Halotydeus destructor]
MSKNVDGVVEEITDYVLRDFVFSWYVQLVEQDKFSLDLRLKNEMWVIFSRLLARVRTIDETDFMTRQVVERITKHFHKVNLYHQTKMSFELSAHLQNEESEIHFLRRLSDILLNLVLPKCYLNIKPLRHLLREVLAVQVLHNSIDLISDPDYLNQKILEMVAWQELELERNKKTQYAFAETYDDFIGMIKKSEDIDELKRMRYYIVNEIMQSTTINNLKKERGLDPSKEHSRAFSNQSVKGDHLLSRNLTRYINQLRFAKKLCESRIKALSANQVNADGSSKHLPNPHKTIFGFSVIMNNEKARQYFIKFLENTVQNRPSASEKTSMYLVQFWELVDQMRRVESVRQFEIANDLLFHSYFLNSIKNHIRFPTDVLRGMESFTMGNTGPESFYQTQKVVYRIMEERYYPLFIVSKDYDSMVQQGEEIGLNRPVELESLAQRNVEKPHNESLISSTDTEPTVIDEHVHHAKKSSKKLRKTLCDKQDALTALKKSTDFTSKPVTDNDSKRIFKLEKEVKEIQQEIHQTDNHVQKSQLWHRYLHRWKAELYSILPEAVPQAMILVQLDSVDEEMRCDGWVITRTIAEVIELKRKLSKLKPSLKKIEILRLRNISDDNEELLNKARTNLNELLQAILSDENCCQSEDVYLFFVPSPDGLRIPISTVKNPQNVTKSSLPFASFFGISSSQNSKPTAEEQQSEEELSLLLAGLDGKENQKDDIAEPAYNMINEIFELQDNANWIRKSMIAFVQISFGQTINKQIRDYVSWLTSESMTYYYLCQFRDSMWPNGQLAEEAPERGQAEKDSTFALAREKLLRNVPDFLTNLVGVQNARSGMGKVFDTMQNNTLNKQLIYEILEAFMFAAVPEIRQAKVQNA